jgi:hypothetical protein
MVDQIKGMTEEQVRQFLSYVDSEERYLEKSRQEWISEGRLELAGNDKLELARLQQTKQKFLTILGK